jgi:DNA-binding response OmpR family regulator
MSERVLYIGKLSSGGKICEHLKNSGYEVQRTEGLRPSLRALNHFAAAVVVIDVNDASTINLRRITRTAGRRPGSPFLILLTDDRSMHFEDLVHDSILVRPFTYRRLDDNIRQLLGTRQDYVVSLGLLTLDRRTRRVKTPHNIAQLTPKQFQLLNHFMEHSCELVTRKELMLAVWETDYLGDTRTLDVHIRWLREQVEEDPSKPQLLLTHRGEGYRLEIEGPLHVGGEPL